MLNRLHGDRAIWVSVLLLAFASLLAVYSSTSTLAIRYQDGNTEYYLLKHVVLVAAGLAIMFWAHKLDYRLFGRISKLLMGISIILLAVTISQGEEDAINAANRWLSFMGFTFQPSDLAKFSIIVHLAMVLTKRQEIIRDFRKGFLPTIGLVLVVCGLIAPANLSTAMLIFLCSVMLMYTSGISGRYILGLCLVGLVGLALLFNFGIRRGTWESRIGAWSCRVQAMFAGPGCTENPEMERALFQTRQANRAIALGGIVGNGPGKSIQRNYLPHPYSDFVFAIIVEEYGLLGGSLILLLYLVIFIRATAIVTVSKTFGALLAAGLAFLITAQAFINMGVTVGILPVTGLPLPLVSMGGTSILFTCLSFGVILSVSREAVGGMRNLREARAGKMRGNSPLANPA